MFGLDRLCEIYESLNDDEREVILMVAERALGGREQYGELDLDGDDRDMLEEAVEEAADSLFYFAAEKVKAQRKQRRRRG